MRQFPKSIRDAMRTNGTAATCVPVKLDSPDWESALFVHVAGPECKQDRRILKTTQDTIPVSIESELMTHAKASVVMLRLRIVTVVNDPLIFEILMTPGHITSHFEALKLLSSQPRLCWFFGDTDYRVLRAQQHSLTEEQNQEFNSLAKEAFAHDATIRMTGRYDANAALSEVVAHYSPREGVTRGVETH